MRRAEKGSVSGAAEVNGSGGSDLLRPIDVGKGTRKAGERGWKTFPFPGSNDSA